MAQPFATCSVTFRGEDLAQALQRIAGLSVWCEIQPLPDDRFELRVKEGEEHRAFPGLLVQRHPASAAAVPGLEEIHLSRKTFNFYRDQQRAWTAVCKAFQEAWSPAALYGGVDGVVALIKKLAADHPSRAAEVRFGGWVLRQAQDHHSYLYASRPDKPGEIHLKADDEGFVADVWPTGAPDAAAACAALYTDLGEEAECTVVMRFSELPPSAFFWDPVSGEQWTKTGADRARCETGGDAFEGQEDAFSADAIVHLWPQQPQSDAPNERPDGER